ncbi:MAG TPA: choice-of-anchor D domain-containing protein [Streptosporangiaceae bacterium]|nr:choice-of-anchor D domain-containing protein [Streptosporangiaceae bacterium]
MPGVFWHARKRVVDGRSLATIAAIGLTVAFMPTVAGAATAHSTGTKDRGTAAHGLVPRDDTTGSVNDLRDGWDPNEPALSPAAVSGGSFGQLFSTKLNGQVYGQPLVIGSTVVVTTENDWVYGLDATTGTILWSDGLGTSMPIPSCTDLQPNIGITSSPVYDPSTNTVYVLALLKEVSTQFHLVGINVTTGAITFKQRIVGHPSNDSHLTFDAPQQGQRVGLLLLNGWVYAGFGSHCDTKPYVGYIAGWNLTTSATTLWTDEANVTINRGGIWQGGGGLMSDGPTRFFFTSGNGISPAKGPGNSPPGQLSESTVEMDPQPNGTLQAKDFFSPADSATLDNKDIDFGAGGPVGLPVGTANFPNLLVQAGKDGHIFMLNRDNLGGHDQGPNNADNALSTNGPYAGQWGHPGVFEQSTTPIPPSTNNLNNFIYYVGKSDYVREFRIDTNSKGDPVLTDIANSTYTLGFGSGSPVVTSNGTDPATAVVWVVQSSGPSGTGSFLAAFDALPQPRGGGGVKLKQIWAQSIGTASKFSIVAVSNGMVYVGTRDGNLIGFGIKAKPALGGAPNTTFDKTAVGSTATKVITVKAHQAVTVDGVAPTSIAATDPFTVGQVTETTPGSSQPTPVSFPVNLTVGDELHAPVTFTANVPGGVDGDLTFTIAGTAPAVEVPLDGEAVEDGLFATNTNLTFQLVENDGMFFSPVPVGVTYPEYTAITNDGTKPEKVTQISSPGSLFTIHGITVGTVIKPGQSLPVWVIYKPTTAKSSTSSFTISVNHGVGPTIALNGLATKALSKFTAPKSVDFGTVPVGKTVTKMIHITNAGNQAAVINGTAISGPFRNTEKPQTDAPVSGSDDLMIPVTFTASKSGTVTGTYSMTWSDRFGTFTLKVLLTATGS